MSEPHITITKKPVLVRLTGAHQVTEYNDRNGLFAPHDDGKFYLPEDSVQDAIKTGFRLAPLTQAERLRDVFDAIDKLDAGSMKTALWAATTAESLRAVPSVIKAPAGSSSPAV
jgi:hypothetical protein